MEIGFKGCHPITNLIFFLSVVVFGMLFKHPVTLAVCFISATCYYIRLCRKTAVKSLLTFIFPMLLFVLIINGMFAHYGTTILLTLSSEKNITLEAVIYGLVLGVATITIIMWFFCYGEVVTTDKFMCVFGKILPAGALVISMALRFVPMYKNRLHIIAEAQRGIGKDYKHGDIIERIRNGGKIVSVLITWSLENAVETSDSMKARGYGIKGRQNYSKFKISKKDIISIVIMIIADVILMAGYIKKSLFCSYNPQIEISSISVFGTIALITFTLLCFLPMIIDLMEDIKWNRLKLKI